MKLDNEKAKTIVMRVVEYKLPTKLVAKQFGVSQRRVQQIVKEYGLTKNIPKLKKVWQISLWDLSGRSYL